MKRYLLISFTICVTLTVRAEDLIHSIRPLGLPSGLPTATAEQIEKSKTFDPGAPCPGLPASADHLVKAGTYKSLDCVLQADRFEYWQDDLHGQFLAILPSRATNSPARIQIVLHRVDGANQKSKVEETMTQRTLTNQISFLISMASLKPGRYRATAVFVDDGGKAVSPEAACDFTKVDRRNPVVAIPPDGIPIALETQDFVADATWPVRAGVPLPINAVMDTSRLALFEDGKPVPAQIKPVATWCPEGSVEWVHVDFLGNYKQGKPAEYRLKLLPQPATAPPTALACTQTDDKITVDTGAIRFEVNRKKFNGIETAWFDPTGSGRYDASNPAIQGSFGPYLVDGRIIRFDASNDKNARVVVEEKGPVRVTIRAEGWYVNPEGRVEPFCKFVTRITACAGEPMIRISHHTIITYDTRLYRLTDAGFQIGSTLGESFRLGADGATKEGALPALPATVSLHQDRYDHFQMLGVKQGTNNIEGKISDGWFSLASSNAANPQLTVMLRDIWQKFPKEVEMGRGGVTLHFWPKNGHRAFKLDDELDIKNIYKFWCFHQGSLLDLNLPNDYFEKFRGDYAGGTFECRPEHALNGNGQGLAIANEFAIVFAAPKQAANTPTIAPLFQFDPTASAAPEWNASSGALGRIAAVDRAHFAPMEDAVEKGWLSHTRCVERGHEYGMWNYANTHTYWYVEDNFADLHRVWHNSHYHEVGQTWLMYYRSGSPDLLRWARKSTDNFMNVATVNYAEYDSKGRPRFKFHVPGAMYHCKGLTVWGGELYGMERHDSHAGVAGHWVDPDAFLWDWYLSGDPRAWDLYQMWAETYAASPWYAGTRREANNTLACMVNYYRASWDPTMLPAIRGMGLSLRTHEPLENQAPGPMWHPLWINRYYEQTRDPDYVPFIEKYARDIHLGDTWTTALGALAYEVSGDKTYLTAHLENVADFPKKFFRAPGDPYDWYGVGPGPIGDRWGAYLCWGNLLYALHEAKITEAIPEKITRFGYLVGGRPSLTVYALEPKDRKFTLTFSASSLGGDLHQGTTKLFAPSGKELANFPVPPGGGYSVYTEKRELPADGETGIYKLEYDVYQSNVRAPITDLPFEAMLVPKDASIGTSGVFGYLRPADDTKSVQITLASSTVAGHASPCNVTITDADGKVVGQGSLLQPRHTPPLTVTLDPKQHKLPWKLDVYGRSTLKWTGEADKLLLGSSDEALKEIIKALKK